MLRKRRHIAATAAGKNNARRFAGIADAAANQVGCHQPGNVEADIQHIVAEWRRLNTFQHAMQGFFGQFAGQKKNVLSHKQLSELKAREMRSHFLAQGLVRQPTVARAHVID